MPFPFVSLPWPQLLPWCWGPEYFVVWWGFWYELSWSEHCIHESFMTAHFTRQCYTTYFVLTRPNSSYLCVWLDSLKHHQFSTGDWWFYIVSRFHFNSFAAEISLKYLDFENGDAGLHGRELYTSKGQRKADWYTARATSFSLLSFPILSWNLLSKFGIVVAFKRYLMCLMKT